MSKVLTFNVAIEGLENKIWRKIEIVDTNTVADLAYTILASFNSLAYHLYNIEHADTRYECMVELDEYPCEKEIKDAAKIKLNEIDFSVSSEMIMTYDFGSPTTFVITYLGVSEVENVKNKNYPYIKDGAGLGMLDDISSYELVDIVNDIDKKGKSVHYFTPGYEIKDKYDYRYYDNKYDNTKLKRLIKNIKEGYEVEM